MFANVRGRCLVGPYSTYKKKEERGLGRQEEMMDGPHQHILNYTRCTLSFENVGYYILVFNMYSNIKTDGFKKDIFNFNFSPPEYHTTKF